MAFIKVNKFVFAIKFQMKSIKKVELLKQNQYFILLQSFEYFVKIPVQKKKKNKKLQLK